MEEIGLMQIVMTREGYIKVRNNHFDALPKEVLTNVKNALNELRDKVDASLFIQGHAATKPTNIVSILKDEMGVIVHLDNNLIVGMNKEEVSAIVLALEEAVRAVKEKSTMD